MGYGEYPVVDSDILFKLAFLSVPSQVQRCNVLTVLSQLDLQQTGVVSVACLPQPDSPMSDG